MLLKRIKLLVLSISLMSSLQLTAQIIGKFNVENDLFLAQFDSKTDVDDIQSIAGVATILGDKRLIEVKYHAVAGAYGIQEGLYVPANDLFELAFGNNWSDAHSDFEKALDEVTKLAENTINEGGDIWIAEAGQSDFSASLVKNIQSKLPAINTKARIHIIQHSNWNEESASPDKLAFVKEHTDYIKIPDGNAIGNGSPGFKTDEKIDWQKYITNVRLIKVWQKAIGIANKYNGKEDRYENPAIAKGGMDFSDVSETCWIFGFDNLVDTREFFKEFGSTK